MFGFFVTFRLELIIFWDFYQNESIIRDDLIMKARKGLNPLRLTSLTSITNLVASSYQPIGFPGNFQLIAITTCTKAVASQR